MNHKVFLEQKILEVLRDALKGKRNPEKVARAMLDRTKKLSLQNQLQKLKFKKRDIEIIFQMIFEAVNKATINTNEKYYPMEEIDKLFNLTNN